MVTFQSLIKKAFRLDAQPQSYVLVDKMTLCNSTYYEKVYFHTHLDTKTVSNVHSTCVRMHAFTHTHTHTHNKRASGQGQGQLCVLTEMCMTT